ncbi:MAG TPA: SpoIID/LytB domain-containing protein, partial [Bdellovibrionales bacterium]|nr:SpoIID/LytB domain-containing protein [Bdellovibrionales bacterium]
GFSLRVTPPSGFLSVAGAGMGFTKTRIRLAKSGGWLVDVGGRRQVYHSNRLWVRGQMLRLGIEPVPYDLEIFPSVKKGIDVVARLDLDKYLAGVLPAEMPASWHVEALKAQAVAARSFVLATAFERRHQHYDVDSTIVDQVYKFAVELNAAQEEKVRKAVRDTRGEILTDQNGRPLKAFYSADCGCQSEDPQFVWGKVESYESVKDPTCQGRKVPRWNVKLSRHEVRRLLLAELALPDATDFRTLQVRGRTPSGRVKDVVASLVVDGESRHVAFNSQNFRRIFGFERVRSTNFELKWLGTELQVRGEGLGHGVGLCQTGARAFASQGMEYREILKFYYPRARLKTPKSA